jgi:siroheme synthase
VAGKTADLILVGAGVDGLQLTVEAQRALTDAEHIYVAGVSPQLISFLRAQQLDVTDLTERLQSGDYAAAYADVADFVLRQAGTEPPIALIVPGNPMFLNTLSRFLVQTAGERDIAIQTYPGLSILDAIISDIGLDVTSRGVQVFDARNLATRDEALNPRVPLIVLQLGGLGAGAPERDRETAYLRLAARLAQVYPGEHAITLILRSTGRGQLSHTTVTLERFPALVQHITLGAALFIDALPLRRA